MAAPNACITGTRLESRTTTPKPIISNAVTEDALRPPPRGCLRQIANNTGVANAQGRKVAKQKAVARKKSLADGLALAASAAAGPQASAMHDHANAIQMRGIPWPDFVSGSIPGRYSEQRFSGNTLRFANFENGSLLGRAR